MAKHVLLSDVGGTNARFELRRISVAPSGSDELLHTATFRTVGVGAQAGSGSAMEALVGRFLAECPADAQPDQCVLAVCGPVVDGAAYCASQVMLDTTGAWKFTEHSVSAAAGGAPTVMLNDFVAVGHALSTIPAHNLHCLHTPAAPAAAPEREAIACLGPGTGLGNVFAVWDSGLARRCVLPSEGCMSHFVARSQLQWDCLQSVAAVEGFVPVDRMLGGQGIASWYSFLGHTESGNAYLPAGVQADPKIDKMFNTSDQPAGVVAIHGTAGEVDADPLCVFAIDCYLDTLGQEAANIAMRFLARGGVYIAGGGIATKMIDRIRDGRVLAAYLEQGVSTEVVQNCPLYVSNLADMGMTGVRSAARAIVRSG